MGDKQNGKVPRVLKRFGPYLKKRRERNGLTLRALAELVGTAHSNVYQFEEEGKNPRLTELAALAEAFQEPLDKFIKPVL